MDPHRLPWRFPGFHTGMKPYRAGPGPRQQAGRISSQRAQARFRRREAAKAADRQAPAEREPLRLLEAGAPPAGRKARPAQARATTRIPSSRNCSSVGSDGAPIIRSSARWFIGNMITSRMFSAPASSITIRSIPGAIPACGGAP